MADLRMKRLVLMLAPMLTLGLIVGPTLGSVALAADDHPAPVVAAPNPSSPPTTTLPGVTVERRMDPLSRSDRHLARVKKSLPGTQAAPNKDVGDKTRDYLAAHADPNSASGQQRKMMQGAEQAPPEALPGSGLPAHP